MPLMVFFFFFLNATWLMLYYETWVWLSQMFRWTNNKWQDESGCLCWLACGEVSNVTWGILRHLATWAGKYNQV